MAGQSRVSPAFGEEVRKAMGGLSQSEVALRAQISVGYINRMVRGSVPTRPMIERLAAALHADPAPLLKAAGYAAARKENPRTPAGEEDSSLGLDAAMQYFRQTFDRYVRPVFPDADLPSGAGLPTTRSGIRSRVARLFAEMLEEAEEADPA